MAESIPKKETESTDETIQKLAELGQQIKRCRKCPGLNVADKTESCPGYGDWENGIILVGQSLCEPGMKTQIPFSGLSGVILTGAFQLSRVAEKKNIYITNVVKCHPERNRASKTEEKNNCLPYLVEEISLIKPRLVIPLGSDATKAFLGSRYAISKVAGMRFTNGEYDLIPLLHPSYLTRMQNEFLIRAYIKKLQSILDEYYGG